MTKTSGKVVHEAIDERQHIRTKIPAQAQLADSQGNSIDCDVQDISMGGIGFNCEQPLEINGLYSITIQLSLNRIDLTLKAKVKVVKQDGNLVGAKFVELESQKSDILRYIISSYMSGEIADIDGLFNVMQRENYIKERKQKHKSERTLSQRFQAAIGTLFFLAIGLLALSFVGYKIYMLFWYFPAAQAMVNSNAYVVSMPENGNVSFLLPEGQSKVSPGQPVASISTQLNTNVSTPADIVALMGLAPDDIEFLLQRASFETVIVSPCECTVFYPGNRLDGFGYKGDELVHLLPINNPMYVTAYLPFDRMRMLDRVTQVKLRVHGSSAPVAGRIISSTIEKESQLIRIDIEPESPLSQNDYLKPVWVEFFTGLIGVN